MPVPSARVFQPTKLKPALASEPELEASVPTPFANTCGAGGVPFDCPLPSYVIVLPQRAYNVEVPVDAKFVGGTMVGVAVSIAPAVTP